MQLPSVLDSTVARPGENVWVKIREDARISRISPSGPSKARSPRSRKKSSLRVAGVVPVDAFRQQTFAAALTPARKDRSTAFGTHPGAETVLTFACSLGWLISAFHKTGK
jgi:hypothetical protein